MDKEKVFSVVYNHLREGVYIVDKKRKIEYWNNAAEEITGYTSEEMMDKYCNDNLLRHINAKGEPLCIFGCPLFETMGDGVIREGSVYLRHKSGYRIPVSIKAIPIYEEGKIVGAAEIFETLSEITYEDNLIEELEEYCGKDFLTKLSNRHYSEKFMTYKLNNFKRFFKKFCVMFADIDNFRTFNNEYGHDAGDLVLSNIAKTIKNALKPGDLFGRWGGEEFVGVFDIEEESEIKEIGEKIRILVENTEILYNEEVLSVTISIGITAVREEDGMQDIVNRADQLMYQSKRGTKNCVSYQ